MSRRASDAAEQRVRDVGTRLSNWGRWGADDEIGTLNLITPDAVLRGRQAVELGHVFTLGFEFGPHGPQPPDAELDRFNPLHFMTAVAERMGEDELLRVSDDVVVLPLQASTQWDSLAHVHYDGHLYNGRRADECLSATGADWNSIEAVARHGMTTRGVLLDLPPLYGVPYLEVGQAISPAELDDALAHAGIVLEQGDAVLIRTGDLARLKETGDRSLYQSTSSGLAFECVEWLHEHDVSMVCSDNVAVEVLPSNLPPLECPFHLVAIRDMGLLLGEIFALDALAEACRAHRKFDFQFVGTALPISRAVGSPCNPVVVL